MIHTIIKEVARQKDNRVLVVAVFEGDAGEGTLVAEVMFDPLATLAQVDMRLRAERLKMASPDVLLKELQPGERDIDVTTIGPPVDPTPERTAFITARERYAKAVRNVELGIVAADAAEVLALLDDAKKAYAPEFVGF